MNVRKLGALLTMILLAGLLSGLVFADDIDSYSKPDITYTPPPDSIQAPAFQQLDTETILVLAPYWVSRADTLLVEGRLLEAERSVLMGIQAVASVLARLETLDRKAWIDSLSNWSERYTASFAIISDVCGPPGTGMSAMDVLEMAGSTDLAVDTLAVLETLSQDSMDVVLTDDSTLVDLDTTAIGYEVELLLLPEIPDTMNEKVQNLVDYFTTNERGRKAMTVWLERAGTVIPRMLPVLRANRMPEDLVYLAMIESGFNLNARSYAKAVGPWQFIYSTGKIMGLESNWWYDERRDIERSTAAACRYLRKLYTDFGDWYLAFAGYNCGENRVQREIRRSSTRDFWKMRRLPRQTRGYVPTFLAARRIAKNPQEYGFEPIVWVEPIERDSVIVRETVDLAALAEILAHEEEELKSLNPSMFRWCTPPTLDSAVVYVRKGTNLEGFEEKLAALPPAKKVSWVRHQVRNGEALSVIADRYGTSMRAIMDVPANRLSNPNRIRAGQWLLVPVSPDGAYTAGDYAEYDEKPARKEGEKSYHTVRSGETLSEIAESYHVGLSKLLSWNGLNKHSIIRVGQKLVVYQPAGSSNPRRSTTGTYTVRRGDSPWSIASAHGISTDELLRANNLPRGASIYPGDKLTIPGFETSGSSTQVSSQAVSPGNYTVRSGDSPWSIANAHGITTEELLMANNLSKYAKIHPGDVLVIPGKNLVAVPETQSNKVVHTVRRGDTLWDIASRYQVTVSDLKRWNNIRDVRQLKVGDRLVVYPSGGA